VAVNVIGDAGLRAHKTERTERKAAINWSSHTQRIVSEVILAVMLLSIRATKCWGAPV
jgi:hypothetical protein